MVDNVTILQPLDLVNVSDMKRRIMAEQVIHLIQARYLCEIEPAELLALINLEEQHISEARRDGKHIELQRREESAADLRRDLFLMERALRVLRPNDSPLCPTCHNARHITIADSLDSGPYSRVWKTMVLCPVCCCVRCGKLLTNCECETEDNIEELPL